MYTQRAKIQLDQPTKNKNDEPNNTIDENFLGDSSDGKKTTLRFKNPKLQKLLESTKQNGPDDGNKKNIPLDRMEIAQNKSIENKKFINELVVGKVKIEVQCNVVFDEQIKLPKLMLPEIEGEELNEDLDNSFDNDLADGKLISYYKDYKDLKWKSFLEYINENNVIKNHAVDFVCFGGPLVDFMKTPYDSREKWLIQAVKLNGVIYLYKTRKEQKFKGKHGEVTQQSYCTLKFVWMFTDRDQSEMNEHEKYFVVWKSQFGDHKMLTFNEIVAVDGLGQFIDMKVVPSYFTFDYEKATFKSKKAFRQRMLKWWCNSVILGNKQVVIGKRNVNNILTEIETKTMEDVITYCKPQWSQHKCMDFLNRFLDFVKQNVNDELEVYQFDYNTGQDYINCFNVGPNEKFDVLPEWFIQRQKKMQNCNNDVMDFGVSD